jgi:hypothetical protein
MAHPIAYSFESQEISHFVQSGAEFRVLSSYFCPTML